MMRATATTCVVLACLAVTSTAIAAHKMPADSTSPAAGICVSEPHHVATVRFGGDVPDPRCLQARRGQELRLVNTGRAMTVVWDRHRVHLAHGASWTLRRPMVSYLAPGDHRIADGAEVWMPGRLPAPSPTSAG